MNLFSIPARWLSVWLLACGCLFASESSVSKAGARAARDGADFRSPARSYVTVPAPWRIHVEKPFMDGKPEAARRAVAKLKDALTFVFGSLPEKPGATLTQVDFYLLWGKDSPQGGRASGLNYIRKGEPDNYPHLDPRWEHAVVIFSADNLLVLDDLWTRKALMHELAHAWHIANWPEKHPPIFETWRHSQDKKLYREVGDYKGGKIATAYACTNQLEYFAELSAMYFVGGNYQPFDKAGLRTYDPAGYAMVEALWGVAE